MKEVVFPLISLGKPIFSGIFQKYKDSEMSIIPENSDSHPRYSLSGFFVFVFPNFNESKTVFALIFTFKEF